MSERGVFYDVLAAQAEAIADSIPDDLPEHKFSLSFQRREKAALKAYRRSQKNRMEFSYTPPKMHTKMKYVWLAIILAALTVLTGSFLVWYHISGFTFKREQTNSTVYMDDIENQKTEIKEIYRIPDSMGYVLVNQGITDLSVVSVYESDGKRFTLIQGLADQNFYIDTEGQHIESLKIKDNNGYCIELDGEIMLAWLYDGYVFNIVGNIDQRTAIDLAETVTAEK